MAAVLAVARRPRRFGALRCGRSGTAEAALLVVLDLGHALVGERSGLGSRLDLLPGLRQAGRLCGLFLGAAVVFRPALLVLGLLDLALVVAAAGLLERRHARLVGLAKQAFLQLAAGRNVVDRSALWRRCRRGGLGSRL